MSLKKGLDNIINFPYKIGGLKGINLKNSVLKSKILVENERNIKKEQNEKFNNNFMCLPSKLSNKLYSQVDQLYNQLLIDIFNPDKFLMFNSSETNDSISNEIIYKKEMTNQYSKTFLNHMGQLYKNNQNNKIKEKFQIYQFNPKKNFKNEIIFDKIFIHINFSENTFDKEFQKIHGCHHSEPKKVYVFNYKSPESPIANKFKVRFSFWVKASSSLIILKENSNKFIKDEIHHILLEFDDDINELNYLKFFSRFSFVNLFRFMINSRKIESDPKTKHMSKIDFHLNNLKICDFDFFIGENDKLSKSKDKFGFNEYLYIKLLND